MEIYGFPHQVGGHFGILKASVNCVCKPLNQREYSFYTQLCENLQPYTPKFYGKIRVNIHTAENGVVSMRTKSVPNSSNGYSSSNSLDIDTCNLEPSSEETFIEQQASTGSNSNLKDNDTKPLQQMTFRLRNKRVEAEQVTNVWAGQCQSKVVQKLVNGHDKFFILLEDVVSRFSRPCVVDLKMGTRQYGQDSTEEKRLSQQQKCRQSTSEKLGVRLVGQQLYNKTNRLFHYVNKYEGRRMNTVALKTALTMFLVTAGSARAKRLLIELEELRLLMSRLEGYRFFSSSLLIAFDGCLEGDPNIVVRMIDFAHSTFNSFLEDRPYTGVDEGYLLGVSSLLKFTSEILDQMTTNFVDEKVLHLNWRSLEDSIEVQTRLRKRKNDLDLSLSC